MVTSTRRRVRERDDQGGPTWHGPPMAGLATMPPLHLGPPRQALWPPEVATD